MITVVDEYSNSLHNYCTTSVNNSTDSRSIISGERRLKPIEERWRQASNKRGHGHYTKCPEEPVFTGLVSSLLACRRNVNADLKLPSLSPAWLNIAIDLILSTGNHANHRRSISSSSSSSSNSSPLVDVVSTFIDEWLSNQGRAGRSATITFSLPVSVIDDVSERSSFILEELLIPMLPCNLVAHKVYSCKFCDSEIRMCTTLSSILVHTLRSGLHLEHQLFSFFSKNSIGLILFIMQ